MRQHRARRRRFEPNASLELDFPAEAPLTIAAAVADLPPSEPLQRADEVDEPVLQDGLLKSPPVGVTRTQPRKIIHFPRHPAVELEMELAAPSPETARILDAPEAEQMELLPSFADICLEEAPREDSFHEELDLSAEPASLLRRLSSGLVDAAIVAVAVVVFAAPFATTLSRRGEAAPHARSTLLCALAAGTALWLLFQYLFLVYGKKTPGMNAAGLELLTFDGRPPSFFARCSRALATTLSGLSLGLGFFWALVDEHSLGWHDRISQTYLRDSSQHSAVSIQPM
ncbi:MAG TPA: RDD family protein [Candidatus Angelobacter sp.]